VPPPLDFIARAVVFTSAAAYWAGVLVEARQVRRRIGRSPNVRPRGGKERALWFGWFLVIVLWFSLPFLTGRGETSWLMPVAFLRHPLAFGAGLLLIAAGHAGTYWCYAAMGDTWRMGINRREKNRLVTGGPYQRVRHPIYLLQLVLLAGAALLLPSPLAFFALGFHFVCATIKATDEESYLLALHGDEYRDILSRTGRFLPRWRPGRLR